MRRVGTDFELLFFGENVLELNVDFEFALIFIKWNLMHPNVHF